MRERLDKLGPFLLQAWLLLNLSMYCPTVALASPALTRSGSFAVMEQALQQALHLQFVQALETVTQLESEQEPTLASRLTRGMIAYLQDRWQTSRSTSVRTTGHETLQLAIEMGQKQLARDTDKSEVRLFVGLAAIFDALLQHEQNAWRSLQLFTQGQVLLQQVLIADDTMVDAHLGLGLFYFAGADLPVWLRHIWGKLQRQEGAEDLIQHLQRAAEDGLFSRQVARTFLARIYELEHRYDDAIGLGQKLQETFPENGYYALLTGRSQYAHRQHAACVTTLGDLAARLESGEAVLARRHDRFDLYYFWGLGLQQVERHTEAFSAFRQAINTDPRAVRDETLWAKYHLARLYERRGQAKTAHQLYRTLLRGRNVEDLHRQVQQRLAGQQSSP